MKKFLFMILVAMLLTFGQMQFVSAAQSDGYIHKNHFYAVSFDGEGDAIVRVQIDIENTLDRPIKWVDLEIPGQVTVYKVVQEEPTRHVITYEKDFFSNSTMLRLELWDSIQRQGQGTVVLFYKIPRYAQKDFFGNYNFDFKTIIDNDAILIENLRVAVNVQEGLHLQGGETEIDYRQNYGFVSEMAMGKLSSADIYAPEYNDYYYGIRNASGLVKTARNLDAYESFHVKGNYGENWLAIYFLDIALWIIGVAIILAGIILISKKILKGFNLKGIMKGKGFAKSAAVSLASAVSIVVITGASFIAAMLIAEFSYSLQWVSMLIMLFSLLLSLGALFLPPLYIAQKNNWVQGAATFFFTIMFLIVFTIVFTITIQILFPPMIYY